MANNIGIDFGLLNGTLSEANQWINAGLGEYEALSSTLSTSKSEHANALKAQIKQEAAMLRELKSVFGEVSKLVKTASSDMQGLDRKYAKSNIK